MTDPAPPQTDRFFDGRTAHAHAAVLKFEPGKLLIEDAGGDLLARWPLPEIRIVDENLVNGALVLALTDGTAPRLHLFEGPGKAALLRARPELPRWRAQQAWRNFRQAAIWGGGALALAALLYFGWRDASIAVAGWIPREWEAPIGGAIRDELAAAHRVCSTAEADTALAGLVARIAPTLGGPPVTIEVLDLDQVNAVALPGSHILLFRGLLDRASSPDQVAGVLAHEASHLELRHPMRGIVQQLGVGAVLSIVFGGSDLGALGQLAATLPYSRAMESEADRHGVELLQAAGLRADGLAGFLTVMAETDPGGLPEWLSTHPDPEARAAALEADASGDAALDPAAWRELREICGADDPGEAGDSGDRGARPSPLGRGEGSVVGAPIE
jgi:Zn-dependent protease with chaperone function